MKVSMIPKKSLVEQLACEHWETNEFSVTTTANSPIATVRDRSKAKLIAAAPELLRMLLKRADQEPQILEEIKQIFKAVA